MARYTIQIKIPVNANYLFYLDSVLRGNRIFNSVSGSIVYGSKTVYNFDVLSNQTRISILLNITNILKKLRIPYTSLSVVERTFLSFLYSNTAQG